ncbi:MAG TPA: hypothetical protein V6C97_21675, partial [Oculatellaceae cyanobacterium]
TIHSNPIQSDSIQSKKKNSTRLEVDGDFARSCFTRQHVLQNRDASQGITAEQCRALPVFDWILDWE